jgi:indolepyruvate ferredoxin oxidoreductase
VARLYTNGDFQRRLKQQFDGNYKLNFHLSPPLFNPKDHATGKPRKVSFGPWMFTVFKVLAGLRGLRGTPLDVFGYLGDRRTERRLIGEYRQTVESVLPVLNSTNAALVTRIAALPEMIKGYGHVKDENLKLYQQELAKLLASFDSVTLKKTA